MKFIGIDTSSKAVHIVALNEDFDILAQIKCSSKGKLAEERFYEIIDQFYYQLSIMNVDAAGIESAIYIQNAKATIAISGVVAACKYALHSSGIPFSAVDNNTWKKAVIGRGNAKKPDILEYAEETAGIKFLEQDYADAYCIARFTVEKYKDDNA